MGKIYTVNLPDIGEGVVEGEIIEWLKQPNDLLAQDEPVVVVMTDKATVELPSPYPGKLVKQYFKPGEKAIKDKPLYDIELVQEESVPPHSEIVPAEESAAPPRAVPVPPAAMHPEAKNSKALAAPPTRKLARDLGIDINQIAGTGKEGRVTAEDIAQSYAASSAKPPATTPPLRLEGDLEKPIVGIPNLMAKKMAEANDQIPHFSYFEQLDATRLVQLRHSFKEEAAKQGIHITYMPFIIKALSLSLHRYPIVNSSIDTVNNSVIIHQEHNVGIAISTKQGLIVPVLKNVQKMSLIEVIKAFDNLKMRAGSGKLLPSDMRDSTITISNFGVLGGGGMWATPIINFPEVAILGIARIHKQPIVRNDHVVIRDMLNLSWSFDHRIIDGDLAASFSHHLSTLLQNPAPLL